VDPICPLLTLGGDPRTVSATPDPAHRCSAGGTLTTIDREFQARFCLDGRYPSCERYVAHVEQGGAVGATWRPAAADASFASTRLVVDSAPRSVIARPRRLGAGALLVIGLVLAGGLIGWIGLGGLGAILGPGPSPSASPSQEATPTPTPEASPSPEPSASPTSAATTGPTPTPAATPVTYIVQSGDTLNEIAARFGTTAQAIMAANGLTSDVINVGQVLIIPD
jgi:nucleoid-associated protein YgaU